MRRMALHLASGAICLVATAAATAANSLPLPQGPALPPRKPGFMLYFSTPMGGGSPAALRPKFGFRLEQVRMTGNNGAPDAPDPMQHRGLIGWQMDGHRDMHFSDMRLELGNHVTFDMAHRSFGLSSRSASMTLGPRAIASPAASMAGAVKGGAEPRSFESRLASNQAGGFAARGGSGGFRDSAALLHEVAATAVATFKSRINTPAQQRPFAANHRPQSMHEGGRD
jgi:hypothetical protein